jgi:hypothetical protein
VKTKMCARMVQALLEPGQTELNVTCALTPFDTAAESLLPPFVASAGKATVPDDIMDKGSCVWALNSSTLTLTATLSVPLVRVPFLWALSGLGWAAAFGWFVWSWQVLCMSIC